MADHPDHPDHPPRPPGKDPRKNPNPPPRAPIPFSALDMDEETRALFADVEREEREREEQERESRRQYHELELQNPYRVDWNRDRSGSPTRSSPPIRLRERFPEDELPPRPLSHPLPPLSDIFQPFRGIQPRESSARSTAHASPPGAASSLPPTYMDAMNGLARCNALDILPPFAELASPADLASFSTPRQALSTQYRETFPAAADTGNCDDAHQKTSPGEEPSKTKEDGEEEADNAECTCEFTSPCTLDDEAPDGPHFRKVISHVFGRNKSSTKLIPEGVWVHYCRKHYQRARYRTHQWPFTQCTLILESLNRMQDWGGVKSFELVLRRREVQRLEEGEAPRTRAASSSELLPSGRRHPTPVISPVPDWLRERRGREMSFDDLRDLIVEIRDYMVQLRQEEIERKAREAGNDQNADNDKKPDVSKGKGNAKKAGTAKKSGNAKQTGDAKKSGNTKKSGTTKKIDDPENSDNDPEDSGPGGKNACSVTFPDVEILPRFQQWVLDEALRKRAAEKAAKAAEKKAAKEATKAATKKKGKKGKKNEEHQPDEGDDEAMDDAANNAPAREAGGASTSASDNAGPSNTGPSVDDDDLSLTESARRRSERIFLRAVEGRGTTRLSNRGSVKKPRKKEE